MTDAHDERWLVAAWPGMGGIAQVAGQYLVHALDAQERGEVPPGPYFDVRAVDVENGAVRPPRLPRSRFYVCDRDEGPGLVVFLGEQQPDSGGYRFCEEVLRNARELEVSRVCTFAAMASPIRPEATPRVLGAATRPELLDAAREHGVERLAEGRISGLNGLLIAAAAEHGLDGMCLLGEFPFFANAVANPKSSAAVLRSFSALSGIPVDLDLLDRRAAQVEQVLSAHLEALEQAAAAANGGLDEPETAVAASTAEPPQEPEPKRPRLTPDDRARIETLFDRAKQDRGKAMELKVELDRLGVFDRYEDRFLDLFEQAD